LRITAPNYPTDFAVALAKQCKLLPADLFIVNHYNGIHLHSVPVEEAERTAKQQIDLDAAQEMFSTFALFQQMTALVPYEKAVRVFVRVKLTKAQQENLKLIAELTPLWVKGEVADKLLIAISDSKIDQKSIHLLSETLLKALDTGVVPTNLPNTPGGGTGIKEFWMGLAEIPSDG
jgi:hypothetical protein